MKLSERRFNRILRKREQYLRMMASRAETFEDEKIVTLTNPLERLLGPWTCDFCEREFQSYPALLNHKCDDDKLYY